MSNMEKSRPTPPPIEVTARALGLTVEELRERGRMYRDYVHRLEKSAFGEKGLPLRGIRS